MLIEPLEDIFASSEAKSPASTDESFNVSVQALPPEGLESELRPELKLAKEFVVKVAVTAAVVAALKLLASVVVRLSVATRAVPERLEKSAGEVDNPVTIEQTSLQLPEICVVLVKFISKFELTLV